MTSPVSLRIAINAQIVPESGWGGIETFVRELTAALGRLDDGAEEYVVIGPRENPDWLRSSLGANQTVVAAPYSLIETPARKTSLRETVGRVRAAPTAAARRARNAIGRLWQSAATTTPPAYHRDAVKFHESLNCHVVHFPFQYFVACARPTIFNPHDLLHLHHPSFFSAGDFERREIYYPAACRAAHTVVVASEFIRRDVAERYRLDADKVQAIPLAAPAHQHVARAPDDLDFAAWRKTRRLADRPFAFYPAMLWGHKNHARLLDALALLRDRDNLRVNLICTGERKGDLWPSLGEKLNELRLNDQVDFAGLVPAAELCFFYRAAQFVVLPSLFEAASAPLYEAWQHDVPVACSTAAALAEQAGDAALFFDPRSSASIAAVVGRLAADATLRDDLSRRGKRRLSDFSWGRTAKAYRAVYRRAADRILSAEDRHLLAWNWARRLSPDETAVAR